MSIRVDTLFIRKEDVSFSSFHSRGATVNTSERKFVLRRTKTTEMSFALVQKLDVRAKQGNHAILPCGALRPFAGWDYEQTPRGSSSETGMGDG